MKLYLKTTSDVKCLSKDMDQNLGWYLSLSAEHFFFFKDVCGFQQLGSFHSPRFLPQQ